MLSFSESENFAKKPSCLPNLGRHASFGEGWRFLANTNLRLWSVGLLLTCFGSATPPLLAQEQAREYLKVDKVERVDDDKKIQIKVRGKRGSLPKGTKVSFQITWMFQPVHTEEIRLNEDSFSEVITINSAPIVADDFSLIAIIDLEKQTRTVSKQLSRDKEGFPPGEHPWTQYFPQQPFKLFSEARVAEEVKFVRDYIEQHISQLKELRKLAVTNFENADFAEDFVRKDKFDEKKWRKFYDEQVIAEMRKLQKDLESKVNSSRFNPYRGPLFNLTELNHCIAWHILNFSKSLYDIMARDPDPMDTDPKKHD